MKYLGLLLILGLLLVAGCEEAGKNRIAVQFTDFDGVQPSPEREQREPIVIPPPEPAPSPVPIPNCRDGIQNSAEDGVDCGGPCAPCYVPPTHQDLFVVNGGFETVNAFTFTDYDNYVKLGYVYARNIIGPINGVADMKIKITQAKKAAVNRPSFKVMLSEPLIPGIRYEAGFSVRDVKGTHQLHSISLGQMMFQNKVEFTEGNHKVVKFTFTADISSEELFINFDGTRTATFRVDDFYVNALN